VLCRAKFTEVVKSFAAKCLCLEKCICPKIKAFWEVGCIYAGAVGGVCGVRGRPRLVGAAGRDRGELRGALVPRRSCGTLPSLSSAIPKS